MRFSLYATESLRLGTNFKSFLYQPCPNSLEPQLEPDDGAQQVPVVLFPLRVEVEAVFR